MQKKSYKQMAETCGNAMLSMCREITELKQQIRQLQLMIASLSSNSKQAKHMQNGHCLNCGTEKQGNVCFRCLREQGKIARSLQKQANSE